METYTRQQLRDLVDEKRLTESEPIAPVFGAPIEALRERNCHICWEEKEVERLTFSIAERGLARPS
jgi:hypothetical protein